MSKKSFRKFLEDFNDEEYKKEEKMKKRREKRKISRFQKEIFVHEKIEDIR